MTKLSPYPGGPAFPTSGQDVVGMSLRDYFAAAAFSTLAQIVFGNAEKVELKRNLDEEAFAIQAYKFADALLAERNKS